ncbi:unnamed protein product, partial [Chondrus crispus]
PVAYASRKLNKAEQGYSTHERELLAILIAFTLVKVDENILKSLEREYRKDPDFKNAFETQPAPFSKNKNRLYFENRLCIPKGKIREIVLHDNHESLFGAHRGFKKTLQYVRRHLYWPSMNKELHEYIKTCPKCQEAKSLTQNKVGKFRPFPLPLKKWEQISMYFIFDLPRTNTNKSAILVVVDKLSKHTHFVPIESNHTAKDTAEVFYNEIYKHHGLPRKIISDRDTRFTSTLWKEIMKLLRVKLNLSTAFHPQTDGQSERAFRTLQEMLRCFVSYTQRDWSKHLPGLEFAYNNHISDTTKQTPFFLEYGQHPLSVSDVLHSDGSETPTVTTQRFLENIRRANEIAKLSITASNERNAQKVNKHRRDHSFHLGDQVMLSTKNLPLKTGRSKKLSPKYIGPFEVIDILASGNAYKLQLPEKYQNLHPTFHISLLKPYYNDQHRRTIGRESAFQTEDKMPPTVDLISHRNTQDFIDFLVSETQETYFKTNGLTNKTFQATSLLFNVTSTPSPTTHLQAYLRTNNHLKGGGVVTVEGQAQYVCLCSFTFYKHTARVFPEWTGSSIL